MLLFLLLLSVVFAGEGRTGAVLPSAEDEPGGRPSLTLGAGAALLADPQWLRLGHFDVLAGGGGARLSGLLPLGERVAVGFGLTSAPYAPVFVLPSAHARWTVARGKAGAVGLFGGFTTLFGGSAGFQVVVGDLRWDPTVVDLVGLGALGISAKGRVRSWTFEGALPLVAIFPGTSGDRFVVRAWSLGRPRYLVLGSEARVSYGVGARSEAFVAFQNVAPCGGWRHDHERWALEAAVCSIGTVSTLSLEGSLRFGAP